MKVKISDIIIYIFLGILVFFVLLPNSPYFHPFPSEDSGSLLYHGKKILDGFIPYRDTWEHKGPLIFYINALGLALGGGSVWGVWFLEFVFLFVSSVLAYILVRNSFGERPALFAIVLMIASLVLVLSGGNLTEEYNILLQFLIFYLFLRRDKGSKHKVKMFVIGLIGAASFLIRQNLIGAFASVVIFLFLDGLVRRRIPDLIKDLIVIFAGFSLPILLTLLYFEANKSLDFLFDVYFRFNFTYSSPSFISRMKTLFMGFWILARSGLTFVAVSAWIYALIIIRGKKEEKFASILSLALIGLPIEVVLSSISGIHPTHYYMTWLAPATILSGFFASQIKTVLLFVLLIPMVSLPLGILTYEFHPDPDIRLCQEIGWFLLPGSHFFECGEKKLKTNEYIKSHSSEKDYVLLWGFAGSLNFLSGRSSPSRFTYHYPLFFQGYTNETLIKGFLDDIRKKPPLLVIDASSDHYRVPPLDSMERKNWSGGVILPSMNGFFEYFNSHYEFVESIEDWHVYEYLERK